MYTPALKENANGSLHMLFSPCPRLELKAELHQQGFNSKQMTAKCIYRRTHGLALDEPSSSLVTLHDDSLIPLEHRARWSVPLSLQEPQAKLQVCTCNQTSRSSKAPGNIASSVVASLRCEEATAARWIRKRAFLGRGILERKIFDSSDLVLRVA